LPVSTDGRPEEVVVKIWRPTLPEEAALLLGKMREAARTGSDVYFHAASWAGEYGKEDESTSVINITAVGTSPTVEWLRVPYSVLVQLLDGGYIKIESSARETTSSLCWCKRTSPRQTTYRGT
jgi:hypothetical protein